MWPGIAIAAPQIRKIREGDHHPAACPKTTPPVIIGEGLYLFSGAVTVS